MRKVTWQMLFLLLLTIHPASWTQAMSTAHDELDYIGAFGNGEVEVDTSDIKAIKHGLRNSMKVALTFDDGPFVFTGRILDTLAAYGVKATFFMVGIQVEKYPEIAARIVEEGHEIGNHTYSHKHLTQVDSAIWKYQIDQCSDAIYEATGVLPKLFRPPYNQYNNNVLDYITDKGMTLSLYDVDPRDWGLKSSSLLKKRVMKEVKPGAIIVFHDLSSPTRSALGSIIESLVANGYELVTMSEMIQDLAREIESNKP